MQIFLKELIDAGMIKQVIDRRYSLEQIVVVYKYVEKEIKGNFGNSCGTQKQNLNEILGIIIWKSIS